MDHHNNLTGVGVDQKMADSRWMMVLERRTWSGGIAGIRADITELKEAEALRLRQKEIIEATLENVERGVIIVDDGGSILAYNNFFENKIGFGIGGYTNFEEWATPDGSAYSITHIPLDSGGYVRTYNDITIRKKDENELRKNKTGGKFQ